MLATLAELHWSDTDWRSTNRYSYHRDVLCQTAHDRVLYKRMSSVYAQTIRSRGCSCALQWQSRCFPRCLTCDTFNLSLYIENNQSFGKTLQVLLLNLYARTDMR
jgi:hypothetical protein